MVLRLPLVVLLQQHRSDKADDRRFIGKDADDLRVALNLLVEVLNRVHGMDLRPVLNREVRAGTDIDLAVVDEGG